MIHVPTWAYVLGIGVDVALALNIARVALNVRKEHKQWVQKFEYDVEMMHIERTLQGDERVCGNCMHVHSRGAPHCGALSYDNCGCRSICLCADDT